MYTLAWVIMTGNDNIKSSDLHEDVHLDHETERYLFSVSDHGILPRDSTNSKYDSMTDLEFGHYFVTLK